MAYKKESVWAAVEAMVSQHEAHFPRPLITVPLRSEQDYFAGRKMEVEQGGWWLSVCVDTQQDYTLLSSRLDAAM